MISRRHFLQATTVAAAALSRISTAEDLSNNCKPLPAAWADYEDDGVWSETHRSKLVWHAGEPCTY